MSVNKLGWLVVSVSLIAAVSCASPEKTQKSEVQEKGEPEKEISIRPSWFMETNRKTADSLKSFGYGMAVSYDSTESIRKALVQAKTHFKNNVGDSLEKVRKFLLQSNDDRANYLEDPSFLIDLRNAVGDLPSITNVADTEIRTQKRRYVGFVRVYAEWPAIKRYLRDDLSEYPEFLKAI